MAFSYPIAANHFIFRFFGYPTSSLVTLIRYSQYSWMMWLLLTVIHEHSTIVAYLDLGQLVFEATIDPNNLLDQEVGDALRRMINAVRLSFPPPDMSLVDQEVQFNADSVILTEFRKAKDANDMVADRTILWWIIIITTTVFGLIDLIFMLSIPLATYWHTGFVGLTAVIGVIWFLFIGIPAMVYFDNRRHRTFWINTHSWSFHGMFTTTRFHRATDLTHSINYGAPLLVFGLLGTMSLRTIYSKFR